MKLLITGDWHIRGTSPEYRTDDYVATQEGKIAWILGKATETECEYILQPGDFWDNPRISFGLYNRYVELFKGLEPKIVSVFGQHDLGYHVERRNTPLYSLWASDYIMLPLNTYMTLLPSEHSQSRPVKLYTQHWGESLPETMGSGFKILLCHRMITSGGELWPGQEDFSDAEALLRTTDFNLIVSGDNHKQFLTSWYDRILINAGSLMRANIDQLEHEPAVFIFDTEKRTGERIPIPVKPIEEVMDLERALSEKENIEHLQSFVEKLSTSGVDISGLDFVKNVNNYIEGNEVDQETIDIIVRAIKDAGSKTDKQRSGKV